MPRKAIILAGFSGAGKSSILEYILQKNKKLRLSISTTTRPPRPGEIHGRDYFFVSPEQFEETLGLGGFLEYSRHFEYSYGTGFIQLEQIFSEYCVPVFDVEVDGAQQIMEFFGLEDVLRIFLTPKIQNLDTASAICSLRLAQRGMSEQKISLRIQRMPYEWGRVQSDGWEIIENPTDGLAQAQAEVFTRIVGFLGS